MQMVRSQAELLWAPVPFWPLTIPLGQCNWSGCGGMRTTWVNENALTRTAMSYSQCDQIRSEDFEK